jgi:hypothetical protein
MKPENLRRRISEDARVKGTLYFLLKGSNLSLKMSNFFSSKNVPKNAVIFHEK